MAMSEETKRKISASKKGKKPSDETRKKMSAAHKGKNNPMYGRKWTDEQRAKLSKANKGRVVSPETRKKIGDAHRGKIMLTKRNNWSRISEEIEELYDNVWEGDEKYLSAQCINAIQDHFKLKSKSTAWNYYKHWREEYDHNITLSSDVARYEHHAMNKENGFVNGADFSIN